MKCRAQFWRYESIDSLKDISIATIGGYAYSEEFDAYVEQFKSSSKVQVLNANNALEQNIKKLLAGRVDALVESDLVMIAKLETAKLVRLLNNGLIELRQSGELETILRRYGLKDWQK